MKYFITFILLIYIKSETINTQEEFYNDNNMNNDSSILSSEEEYNDLESDQYENEDIYINSNEEDIIDGVYKIESLEQFNLNIKKNGTDGNILVILFHSKTCPHCIKFMPKYSRISEQLINNNITNIKLSKIEGSTISSITKKYNQINVNYFPVLYLYKNGIFILYNGGMNEKDVLTFIDRIGNFKCKEIMSYDELNKFINYKTIYSLDKNSQFILGLFKNYTSDSINKFIVNNFININGINSYVINEKHCYYFFYDNNINNKNLIIKNNTYLNNIINNNFNEYKNMNENNNYLIYTYNYQKGLNSFSLFKTYLNILNDSKHNINISLSNNKNIKIIENKYRSFINQNYLYKYYYLNKDNKDDLFQQNKKIFIFSYSNNKTHKLFINTINKILNENLYLNDQYLFLLNKLDKNNPEGELGMKLDDGVILFDLETLDDTNITETYDDLNKTYIEMKIIDIVRKFNEKKFNDKNSNINDNINIDQKFNFSEEDEELIKEINKTIIEDNLRQQNNKDKTKHLGNHNKYYKSIDDLNIDNDDELNFERKLIMIPICLIIYSILYFYFYKYVLVVYSQKINYIKLSSDDYKMK